MSWCREEEGEKIIKEDNRERINFLFNFFSFHSLFFWGVCFVFFNLFVFYIYQKIIFFFISLEKKKWHGKRCFGFQTVISNLNVLTAH